FDTTEAAVAAYIALVRHEQVQGFLRETPEKNTQASPLPSLPAALHQRALARGEGYLGWQETRDLLALFGFQLNAAEFFPDQVALFQAAERLNYPLAVRLLHRQYLFPFAYSSVARHRWRGVGIDVQGPDQLKAEAERLKTELPLHFPHSPTLGITVQPMRRRLDSLQFSLGITRDAVYGPVLLFGLGGSAANVRSDRNSALPPLNRTLARLLLQDTHVYELLQERSRQPLLVEEVLIDAIMRLSELAEQCPWLAGLEINLLLENERELVVLGAAAEHGDERRTAISTYPQHWLKQVERKGSTYTLRPVRAEDEPELKALYEAQRPESLRLRFFGSRLHFAHRELAAMCQIDYRREMAMVLENQAGRLVGEVRGWTRIDAHSMEFAILLDASAQGSGLAQTLLGELEAFAVTMKVDRMTADILPENTAMLALGNRMGYQVVSRSGDSVLIEKPLEL
ncbi:MAG: GNAT family N-acetyltransferase, partial [Natronospirillum sp.]